MRIRIELEADDGAMFQGDVKLVRVNKSKRASVPVREAKPGKVNCPAAIKDLWQKGKFRSPLSFATIRTELSHGGGYNFPNNTLMMALSNASYLTRRGTKGSYTWSQRHPYNG